MRQARFRVSRAYRERTEARLVGAITALSPANDEDLSLSDISNFDEKSGWAVIDPDDLSKREEITFEGVNFDNDTLLGIHRSSPKAHDDRAVVQVGKQPQYTRYLDGYFEADETFSTVEIPRKYAPNFKLGPFDHEKRPVIDVVESPPDSGDWYVEDIPYEHLMEDGSNPITIIDEFIDLSPIEEDLADYGVGAEDGVPPSQVTGAKVIGGIGRVLHLSADTLDNSSVVRYNFYVQEDTDPGEEPGAEDYVGSYQTFGQGGGLATLTLKEFPAGHTLAGTSPEHGQVYFLRVRAEDGSGEGPASAPASGSPFDVDVALLNFPLIDLIGVEGIKETMIAQDSISTPMLKAASVVAAKVATNAILTKHLLITNFTNLVQDGGFEANDIEASWANRTSGAHQYTGAVIRSGTYAMRISASAGIERATNALRAEAKPGQSFYAEAWARCLSSTQTGEFICRLVWRDKDGLGFATSDGNSVAAITDFTKSSVAAEAPDGTVGVEVQVYRTASDDYWYVDDVLMRMRGGGELIVDGSIITEHMQADSINANRLSVNTLNGDRLIANTISTQKLIISNFSNLIENPSFELGDVGWGLLTGWEIVNDPTNARSGDRVMKRPLGVSGGSVYNFIDIQARPGDHFYAECWVKSGGGGNHQLNIVFRKASGSIISSISGSTGSAESDSWGGKRTVQTGAGGCPSGTGYIELRLISGGTNTGDNYFDDFLCRMKGGAELIVDGSILTQHLTASLSLTSPIMTGGTFRTADPLGAIDGLRYLELSSESLLADIISWKRRPTMIGGFVTTEAQLKLIPGDITNPTRLRDTAGFEIGEGTALGNILRLTSTGADPATPPAGKADIFLRTDLNPSQIRAKFANGAVRTVASS